MIRYPILLHSLLFHYQTLQTQWEKTSSAVHREISDHLVSYESYLQIFNSEYVSFGYPRSDTCSECDTMKAQKIQIQEELACLQNKSTDQGHIEELTLKLKQLKPKKKLLLRKVQTFYKRIHLCRLHCTKTKEEEAIAMDFQKNMPVPNTASNLVYYKRQLIVHLFNIHVLSAGESVFYGYDEIVANKGADKVGTHTLNATKNMGLISQSVTTEIPTDQTKQQSETQPIPSC